METQQNKIYLLYTMFNGFDQLIESINAMVDHVDEILICYQDISNTGEKSKTIFDEIEYLNRFYPNIRVIIYETDLRLNTKENERRKHNMMIQHAKKRGATHFILSACDHIYQENHIKYAMDFLQNNDFDVILTKMFTYYKKRNWRLDPIESYFMPFIHKMHKNTEISTNKYPVLVDPSVKVNTNKIHVFNENECILHHFSMVRTDIENKFKNAAASINWKPEQIKCFIDEYNNAKPGDQIKYFKNRTIIEINSYI